MKKFILLSLAAMLCVATVSAQNDQRESGSETKKGYNILPAKGDFAIGVSANPFLNFGRSLLNGNQPAPNFSGVNGNVYFKYFTRNNQAFRFGVSVGVTGDQIRVKVPNDAAFENDGAQALIDDAHLFDKVNYTTTNISLLAGYEWRRGYGRLQAFYGGQVGINFETESTSYKWANEMTIDRATPNSATGPDTYAQMGVRPLKETGPNGFGFSLAGFAGIEYFFARKMSLGAELGLGFQYMGYGESKITAQSVNNGAVEEITRVNGKGPSSWHISTTDATDYNYDPIRAVINGNIFLMFHF
jgi:hypothetical protein